MDCEPGATKTRTPSTFAPRLNRWTALALVAVLAIAGCGGESSQPRRTEGEAPPTPDYNVVLITIDTLRADHLGCYGYDRATTPNIDRLANESMVFEWARSTCSATAPSVATILTGLHRVSHGVARNGSPLPDVVMTLPEIMKQTGYATRGIISNPTIGPDLGFGQGFDEFGFPEDLNRSGPERFGGPPVVSAAVDSLQRWSEDGSKFFMWAHFMDPHGPYFPPKPFRDAFPATDYELIEPLEVSIVEGNHGLEVIPRYQRVSGQKPGDMVKTRDYRARYDAEINYMDSLVGELLDTIRGLGLWDNTIVVFTADHGESLGEHEYFFQHGWYLYDDCLRVPLIIHSPESKGAPRVTPGVSLVDLVPTILDMAGVAIPEHMEGSTLLGEISKEGRPAFTQTYYGNQLTSLTHDGFKIIFTPPPPEVKADNRKPDGWKNYWPKEARFEYYDLESDPGETINLSESSPPEFIRMRDELVRWLNQQNIRHNQLLEILSSSGDYNKQIQKIKQNIRLEEQLRALGYVE